MARALIGRTVRRLRTEQALSQQALATRLGVSPSYLNLIEHDQRAVTASLLIKLGETLRVDLATLSGREERRLEVGLREAFADPLLSADAVPEAEIAELAAIAPNATRAVLALYRAWRVAREDAGASRCPPAAGCCCRTRKRGISSMIREITSPRWKPQQRQSARTCARLPPR